MNAKKIFTIAASTLLCAAALINSSCKKNQKGTFTVKGRLIDSCGGTPYQNINIIVRHTTGGPSPNVETRDSIGVGKTDANGNFDIVCKNWGRGNFTIYTPANFSGFTFVNQYFIENEEGKIYDLGDIYKWDKFFTTINITKTGSFSSTDTLYFGGKTIYPVTAGTSKEQFTYSYLGDRSNASPDTRTYSFDLYWAFGKVAYDNAVQNKLATNRINAKYVYCGQPEQVMNITISK